MMLCMDTNIDNLPEIEYVPTPVSLRADQREWLDDEARRQMHRNRSRLVQEAIDLYRRFRSGEVEIKEMPEVA